MLVHRVGALNQILLIRAYDDDESEIATGRDVIARSENPYEIGDLLTGASSDTYVSFPFLSPMQAGAAGPFFEVRTYVLRPDGLAPTIELWRRAAPTRAKVSPLLAAMYSLSGRMPRFMHIWPYASLDERQRVRGEAVKMGVWPPPGGPDQLIAQKAEIFLAAPFSPIR
jgi:hypothetical protein